MDYRCHLKPTSGGSTCKSSCSTSLSRTILDLPDRGALPGRLVPAYRRTLDICASRFTNRSFSIFETGIFRYFVAVLQVRDEGFPVEWTMLQWHVSDNEGRKYSSFHAVSRTRCWTCEYDAALVPNVPRAIGRQSNIGGHGIVDIVHHVLNDGGREGSEERSDRGKPDEAGATASCASQLGMGTAR